MAKEDEKEKDESEEAAPAAKSNMKVIIIAVVAAVLLSGAVVGGTLFFVMGNDDKAAAAEEGADGEEVVEEESEPTGPPMYHSLDPKFVVSFRDQRNARFMQFEVDVMTRSEDTVKKLDEHMSAVRSSLLMLFDELDYSMMSTKDGKQQLLMAITKDVNETVDRMAGDSEEDSAVESAYFTSFVIQ